MRRTGKTPSIRFQGSNRIPTPTGGQGPSSARGRPTPPPPKPTPSPPPRTATESPRSPAPGPSVGLHNGSRPATHHPSQTWIRPPPTLAVFRVRMGGGFEHPNPAAGRPPSRNTTYFELSYPPSRAMPRYRLQLLKLFIWIILSRFIDLRSVRSGYIRATLGKGSQLFSISY